MVSRGVDVRTARPKVPGLIPTVQDAQHLPAVTCMKFHLKWLYYFNCALSHEREGC